MVNLLLVEQRFIYLSFPFVSVNFSHGKSGCPAGYESPRLVTLVPAFYHVSQAWIVSCACACSSVGLSFAAHRQDQTLGLAETKEGRKKVADHTGIGTLQPLYHETAQPQQLVIHTMHTVLQFGAWGAVPSLFSFQLLWDL